MVAALRAVAFVYGVPVQETGAAQVLRWYSVDQSNVIGKSGFSLLGTTKFKMQPTAPARPLESTM